MKKTIVLTLLSLGVSGCSSLPSFNAEPTSAQAVEMTVTRIVTPTRVIARSGGSSYHVDLAYFYPSTVLCADNRDACRALEKIEGKRVWVEREYDRFGLQMHTLWLDKASRVPVNIDLLLNSGYSRMVDHIALPNGKSELVSKAADLGFNKAKQSAMVDNLKPWQKEWMESKNAK